MEDVRKLKMHKVEVLMEAIEEDDSINYGV